MFVLKFFNKKAVSHLVSNAQSNLVTHVWDIIIIEK